MNDRVSLTSLRQQSAYKLDVDVQKGERIFGAFGKIIYEAQWIGTKGSPLVLLEMSGEKANKEAILNITLSHPHIIKTYGTVESNTRDSDSNSILLLQEYAPDGDLAGRLSSRMFIPSQSVLLEIFIQVSDAMIYLSKNGIIHGDLACRNVLLFKTHPFQPKLNLVKLIDFGLAQDSSTASDVKIDIPVRYAAPEIIRSKGRSGYSQKSDVFSFGALMWEACSSGRIPYENIHDDNAICQLKLDGDKLQRPKECDPNIWALMLKCWNNIPEDRPNCQTIHTQLKNIQNTNLPDSDLSPSPVMEENPRLFNPEYETCRECGLRYTDYQSHQNTCSEQELMCYICQKQFRRATYDNHMEVCGVTSDADILLASRSSTSSSDETEEEDLSFCQHCNRQYDRHELENHERNCRDNPRNRRTKIRPHRPSEISDNGRRRNNNQTSSFSRLPDRRESIKPIQALDQSKSNLLQLPCEICEQLIDALQFNIHQIECKKRDDNRIKLKEREIEKQESIKEIECSYCPRRFSVDEIDDHQESCPSNPANVPDTLPTLRKKLSSSVPNIRNISTIDSLSTSSNEHFQVPDPPSQSTIDVRAPAAIDKRAKTLQNNKKNGTWGSFRKMLSRLWFSKKK